MNDSYQKQGGTVFTSQYLKKRGTCCKSACLHCPYGFTLKKNGLQFLSPGEEHTALLKHLVPPQFPKENFSPEHILLVELKGIICGVLFKNHIVIKELFLLEEFKEQGLSKELVESYLFI